MSEAPRNGKQARNANSSNTQRATSSQGPQRIMVTGSTRPASTTSTSQSLLNSEYRPADTGSATPHAHAAYHHPPTPIPHRVQSSESVSSYPFPQSSQGQHQYTSSVPPPDPVPVPVPAPPGAHGPLKRFAFRGPYASEPPSAPGSGDSRSTSPTQATGGSLDLDAVQVPELPPGGLPRVNGWDRLSAARDEALRAFNAANTGATATLPPAPRRDGGDTSSHAGDSRQTGGSHPGFMNPGYQPTRRPRDNDRSNDSREGTPPPPYCP